MQIREIYTFDYYPYGMLMPGRSYSSTAYKYGFNGKEKDDEVSGTGNQYDYGFRIYNPRIAKFLSVDPLTKSYPWYTPYQFAGNKPIWCFDIDGLEEDSYLDGHVPYRRPTCLVQKPTSEEIVSQTWVLAFAQSASKSFIGGIAFITELPTRIHMKSKISGTKYESEFGTSDRDFMLGPLKAIYNTGETLLTKDPTDAEAWGQVFAFSFAFKGVRDFVFEPVKGAKYTTGNFIIGPKTFKLVSAHLEQFGKCAENDVMLERMQKIANKQMSPTEIDLNFAKHELREYEMMKDGASYEEAHEAVLKEQGMYHPGYEKKLYTPEALDAGNNQLNKETK